VEISVTRSMLACSWSAMDFVSCNEGRSILETAQTATDTLAEKPATVPLSTPQISYGLAWDRNRAPPVRGRRLNA
jgi:hypothetical protein